MAETLKRVWLVFFDIIQTIVLALAIFMIAYLFVLQPHQVKGLSMFPNFEDREYLLTEKVSYRFGEPKRGDVIVFEAPVSRKDDYIKRILALPGETIAIIDSKVYVNEKPLPEPYLPADFRTQGGAFLSEGKRVTLGPQEYFAVGDNRDHSSDSRAWGPIKKSDIVGRAWIVYWPPKQGGAIPGASYPGF